MSVQRPNEYAASTSRARAKPAHANPWGAADAPAAAPVKLHDVMDEELAVKLQREEEEQWAREMALATASPTYGTERDKKVGWCFVEVPSADCEFGAVSVMEQEMSLDDDDDDGNDSDFALAMELQAQEADEYDRLRRQEASSMERIQVLEMEHPKQPQLSDFLGSAAGPKRRSRGHNTSSSFGSSFSAGFDAGSGRRGHGVGLGLSHSNSHGQIQTLGASASGLSSTRTRPHTPVFSGSGRLSFSIEGDDKDGATPSSETATSATSATFDDDDPDDEQDEDDDDLYLEDDCGLPIRKFNSLHLSLRSLDLDLDHWGRDRTPSFDFESDADADAKIEAKMKMHERSQVQPLHQGFNQRQHQHQRRVGVSVEQF